MCAREFFRFCTLTLVAAFTVHAGSAKAASDRLLITSPSGGVLFDNSMPDAGTAGPETTLTFTGAPTNTLPPPLPPPAAITTPGADVIVLTEPAGEPPDPTEPPVTISGPTGPVVVSDIIISTLGIPAGAAPPFVMLASDFQDLQQITSLPPNARIMSEPFPEAPLTLTGLAGTGPGGPFGPISVVVQSDAVPEPGTVLLLGSGLIALVAVGARRHV